MVASVDVDRSLDEEVQVSNAEMQNEDAEKEIDIQALVCPIPIAVVRAHLSAFEEESIRRLLLRYSGADVLPKGWTEGPKSNGIQVVYGEVKDSAWHTMRTTGKVAVPAHKVAQVLVDPIMVPQYDDMTKEVKVLEVFNDRTQARLVSAKAVMFTSARDFCVVTTVQREESGRILIATRSADHPDGNQSGYVRAISHISGYIVTPDASDPNACEVSVLAHMDLGGSIPAMVIKYLGLSAPIKLVEKIGQVCMAS